MTLYRKYRPQKFSDLVGQDHIRDTLLEAIKEARLSHAYLLTGPRGTGKTTTARLIAKAANCITLEKDRQSGKDINGEPCEKCENCIEIADGHSLDIVEIDAASNRGIDDIRALRDQVRFAPIKSKYKIYIIDEVHMLTKDASNALLKTLEEPPSHAIFILATTDPHKVLPTIISRTQRFDFKRIGSEHLILNMEKVIGSEKATAGREALEMVATMAAGGGRDSLSLLEQVMSYSSEITVESVRTVLGIAEIGQVISLLRAIFNSNAEEGLKIAHLLYGSGSNQIQLNASILDVLRKLMTYSVAGSFLAADTEENKQKITVLADEVKKLFGVTSSSKILAVTRAFIEATKIMKETVDPLVAVEVAIIEAVDSISIKEQKLNIQNINSAQSLANAKADKGSDVKVENKPKHESKKEEAAPKAKPEKIEQAPDQSQFDIEKSKKITSENPEVSEQLKTPESKPVSVQGENPISELPAETWDNVIGEVKKENSTLAALLRDAKPMAVESGKLVLGVRFKFHKDKISEVKNVSILEGVICNVTGNSCQVVCEIADFSANKKKESHSDEELASEAERVFSE